MHFKVLSIHQQRAFTLIEMLVVMIIMAMVVTLVVQGFGYSLGLYQRVVNTQNASYKQVFTYQWFRTSLGAQVAMRPDDRGLEGDARQLSTYSYQPLLARQGLKSLIHWELTQAPGELQLAYYEGEDYITVYSWPEASGYFEYLDEQGQWFDQWPVRVEDVTPLPQAVRLVVNSDRESLNYVAVTRTRLRANINPDELLYGRD